MGRKLSERTTFGGHVIPAAIFLPSELLTFSRRSRMGQYLVYKNKSASTSMREIGPPHWLKSNTSCLHIIQWPTARARTVLTLAPRAAERTQTVTIRSLFRHVTDAKRLSGTLDAEKRLSGTLILGTLAAVAHHQQPKPRLAPVLHRQASMSKCKNLTASRQQISANHTPPRPPRGSERTRARKNTKTHKTQKHARHVTSRHVCLHRTRRIRSKK